ncbi:MAG: sigma-70 family RNA polymerase sigma factor [Firmicutes bacterium]|nr:sigma-70 family RNA polymerase sigma factor [Bacillota bacterium]
MSDREKIEQILELYPLICSKCKINIIKSKNRTYSIPAYNYAKVSGGETNAIYSDVEQYVTDKADLDGETVDLIHVQKAISVGLECLTKNEYLAVKSKYFRGLTDVETAAELDKSRSTVQNHRSSALEKLKKADLYKIWSKYEQIFTTLLENV